MGAPRVVAYGALLSGGVLLAFNGLASGLVEFGRDGPAPSLEPVTLTVSSDGAAVLSGSGAPGARMTLMLGGDIRDTVVVDGGGRWVWSLPADVAPTRSDLVVVVTGPDARSMQRERLGLISPLPDGASAALAAHAAAGPRERLDGGAEQRSFAARLIAGLVQMATPRAAMAQSPGHQPAGGLAPPSHPPPPRDDATPTWRRWLDRSSQDFGSLVKRLATGAPPPRDATSAAPTPGPEAPPAATPSDGTASGSGLAEQARGAVAKWLARSGEDYRVMARRLADPTAPLPGSTWDPVLEAMTRMEARQRELAEGTGTKAPEVKTLATAAERANEAAAKLAAARRELQKEKLEETRKLSDISRAEADKRAEDARRLVEASRAELEARRAAVPKAAESAAGSGQRTGPPAPPAEGARKPLDGARQPAGTTAADDAQRGSKEAARAAPDAREATAVVPREEDRRRAEMQALEAAQSAAAASRAAQEKRLAEAKRAEEAQRAADLRRAEEQRRLAEARRLEGEQQRAEDARRAAAAKAAAEARSKEDRERAQAAAQARRDAATKIAADAAADAARREEAARMGAAASKAADKALQAEQPAAAAKPPVTRRDPVPPGRAEPRATDPSRAEAGGPARQSQRSARDDAVRVRPGPAQRPAAGEQPGPRERTSSARSRSGARADAGRDRPGRTRLCLKLAGKQATLPGRYVVKRGDTLWHIAARHYDSGIKYKLIYAANRERIEDPDLIFPCQRFAMPARRSS